MRGNYGGTALIPSPTGERKVTTRRFDSLFSEQDIYFLKLDMEGAEKHTIGPGKPMDKWFRWVLGSGGVCVSACVRVCACLSVSG